MPNLLKRQKVLFCTLVLLMLLLPLTVLAEEPGQHVFVRTDEIINGPGFYGGATVQIDGTINGTTFAAGQSVIVNGTINGDLLTAGQEVTVNGTVTGNLYIAGQTVEVNGQVKGDTFGAGQKIKYSKISGLERDAFAVGQDISLAGKVQRQLFAAGENVTLLGLVGDNAHIETSNLRINDSAQIGGNLSYASNSQAYIAPNAKIIGQVDWKKAEPVPAPKPVHTISDYIGWFVFSILGALLFWFLVALWRPNFWSNTSATIAAEPLKTLGVGALALIMTPIAAILLLITIIGIPLGIILGLVYGVSIWLAHIIVAVFAGYWLARRFGWPELHKGVWLVLLGLAILALLGKLPFIGFLVNLAVILTGLGAMVLTLAKPHTPQPPAEPPVFSGLE